MADNYSKTTFEGGVRLVTEQVYGAASISLGFWVAAGSRDEFCEENGVAHLIEHLIFKGTERRDKLVLARELDRLGGLANAFTSREHTCYHIRIRPEQLALAVDIMLDIFQNSLFSEDELLLEKQVIAQEIAMVEDEPEELVHELAAASIWPNHPLGRPVAGDLSTLEGLDRLKVMNWMDRNYTNSRLVISAAGALNHQELACLLDGQLKLRPGADLGQERRVDSPKFTPGLMVKPRQLEQAHMVVTAAFPNIRDDRRHGASLLNWALGGNMSSRLFQEIRERRGLVYSIYSSYWPYDDVGTLDIYAASAEEKAGEVWGLIQAELKNFRSNPLTTAELEEAVEGITTSLILSGESLDSRMSRLGRNEFTFGRPISLEESCQGLAQVTSDDLSALAHEFFAEDTLATCVLGEVPEKDFQ